MPPPPDLRGDFVAFDIEELHAGMQRFAHQQLEGAFGRFQLIALVFHLLDAFQQLAARIFGQAIGQAVLLQLVQHVAAAGEIAHQHALPVAHRFRCDVFVSGRIFQHGADMDAALMRERAVADKGLIARSGRFASSAIKRQTVVRFARFSGPMVVWPSFNSRFAMIEARFAFPQRSP